MSWYTLIFLAIALGMDAFAVSVVVGLNVRPATARHVFRLAFHFGLFQFLMPVVGWLAGKEIAASIQGCDHWIAFALLALIGGKMLWDSRQGREAYGRGDPTRGVTLVALSLATSMDALAVGFSMAMLRVSVWLPAVVIGVVAATMSLIGFGLGRRVSPRCGRWADLAGACMLFLIGLQILVEHLSG